MIEEQPSTGPVGPNFPSLYLSALGLGVVSVSAPLVGALTGIDFEKQNRSIVVVTHIAAISAGAIALLLLTTTLALHWLSHRRFVQLHHYMRAQVEAGTSVETAIERTRTRMEMELAQAGSYLRWLFHRGDASLPPSRGQL